MIDYVSGKSKEWRGEAGAYNRIIINIIIINNKTKTYLLTLFHFPRVKQKKLIKIKYLYLTNYYYNLK